MKEVILKVPEERYDFVIELIQNLGLEIEREREIEIPEWQKNIVRERAEEYRKSPDIGIAWKEARKQIKFKKK